jgi:NAD(P)-dependent dehydrogenase (short-subunit alcohol dehydrogenase family)
MTTPTILITGANRGIGLELTGQFAADGWQVLACCRNPDSAVNQVVRSMSVDLADRGVSVLALHPGWVRTDMGGANAEISVGESADGLKRILQAANSEHSGKFFNYDGTPIPW